MKKFNKRIAFLFSLSTIVLFSSHALANVPFDCKSLSATNWSGNVSSNTGSVSQQIKIYIKDVIQIRDDDYENFYELKGSINGKPLEGFCQEDKSENSLRVTRTMFSDANYEIDLNSNHPLPTQIPLSGFLLMEDHIHKQHVDGMIIKN